MEKCRERVIEECDVALSRELLKVLGILEEKYGLNPAELSECISLYLDRISTNLKKHLEQTINDSVEVVADKLYAHYKNYKNIKVKTARKRYLAK